jgi:hypothetical protein
MQNYNHDVGHISVLCINDLEFWENDNGKSAASYLVTYLNKKFAR